MTQFCTRSWNGAIQGGTHHDHRALDFAVSTNTHRTRRHPLGHCVCFTYQNRLQALSYRGRDFYPGSPMSAICRATARTLIQCSRWVGRRGGGRGGSRVGSPAQWRQAFGCYSVRQLQLHRVDCKWLQLRRYGFDTSIAQIRSLAWTHFKVLLSLAVPHVNAF